MNTFEIRNQFEEDGFVIIEDFFSEQFMKEIDEQLSDYINNKVPKLSSERVFYEDGKIGSIKSMNRMNEESQFFNDFKEHPKVKHLVADIFGVETRDIVSETLQFFGKPAFEGSVTPWHQDNGFQHYSPPDSLMIWVALQDVDEEMGCVVFAQGSHKQGVVSHIPSGVLGFSQTVETPPDLSLFPEIKVVMRRSGISLHHCNTFHRSGANKTNRPRPALSVNYRTKWATPDLEKRKMIKDEVNKLLVKKAI